MGDLLGAAPFRNVDILSRWRNRKILVWPVQNATKAQCSSGDRNEARLFIHVRPILNVNMQYGMSLLMHHALPVAGPC